MLQPMISIDWLASLIGKVICYDANTVAWKRLVYAKALIGITPTKPLPSTLRVCLFDGHDAEIRVRYS